MALWVYICKHKHVQITWNIHASTVGLLCYQANVKRSCSSAGFWAQRWRNGKISFSSNPFWSQRVQRDHGLEEARPGTFPFRMMMGQVIGEGNKPQCHQPGVNLRSHVSQLQQQQRQQRQQQQQQRRSSRQWRRGWGLGVLRKIGGWAGGVMERAGTNQQGKAEVVLTGWRKK